MIEQKGLSRRSFLAGAGIVTGAAVVAAGTGLINPKNAEAVNDLPWIYPSGGLTVATVKQAGYDHYYASGGCMSGTANALIEALISTDTRWDTIPRAMFKYGRGGIGGSWGTLCGSLNGAALVIHACAPTGTVATKLIDALYAWYCGNNFPSMTGYNTSTHMVGTTSVPGATTTWNQTISNSPLCHASVSKWCHSYTTPKSPGGADKSNRCAMVAGDVAEKTAQLLNDYFGSATLPAAITLPADSDEAGTTCVGCHINGGATSGPSDDAPQRWVQMKSTCTTMCHTADRNPCTRP